MTSPTDRRGRSDAAVWQEVEFGSYEADLALWRELAETGGPVLELGAGAGRVALQLAEEGHEVFAVERDNVLAEELEGAASERDLQLEVVRADLAESGELTLPGRPAAVIGPLHVIQVLETDSRRGLLARLAKLASPGAVVALTVVDESTLLSSGAAATQILPDMREFDGWVYSSEPLWVQVGEEALTVRRLRERVSPEGRMKRQIHDEILRRLAPEALEAEAEGAGLRPAGRRQVNSGPNEANSTVVLLEAPG